jgi:VIT1/CCC1 family predicted Fe2+/Mn2+ transporter
MLVTAATLPSPAASCARCTFFTSSAPAFDAPKATVLGGCAEPRHVTLKLRVAPESACADFALRDGVAREVFTHSASAGVASTIQNATALADAETKQAFVLQRVQPALLGLMDGSVSTLAPIFAAAGLTGHAIQAFWIGTAASIGAGISMGLAEALSDDGSMTGRGSPVGRGMITGLATVLGGMLHTLPFLLPDLQTALYCAYAVVVVELIAIAYIRFHFMRTPLAKTIAQVIVGGGIVFGVGVALGRLGATGPG